MKGKNKGYSTHIDCKDMIQQACQGKGSIIDYLEVQTKELSN